MEGNALGEGLNCQQEILPTTGGKGYQYLCPEARLLGSIAHSTAQFIYSFNY